MATRMQQRRGTLSQWTSTNNGNGPILAAGEIGFESDNNRFKIGDGVNHWVDLPYFSDNQALTDLVGGAPELLDTLNELAAAIGDDPAFMTTVATNLSNHQSDTTNIHGIADTAELATKTFAAELLTNATKSNIVITGDKNGLTITAENGVAGSTTDDLTEGTTNKYFTDERAQDAVGNAVGTGLTYTDSTGAIAVDTTAIQARVADVSDTEIGYLNGVTSAIQTQLNDKAPLASPTFTGTATVNDLEISGALTFSGTATQINQTDLTISDPLIYLADGNTANINDLGFVANFNDGTYQHTGLVRDSSVGSWKLFKGVTDEPTNTVNFAQGSLDDLAVAGLAASSITLGGFDVATQSYVDSAVSGAEVDQSTLAGTGINWSGTQFEVDTTVIQAVVSGVSDTEIGYLNGVTSGIQLQLDGKASLSGATFTGDIVMSGGAKLTDVGYVEAEAISDQITLVGNVTIGDASMGPTGAKNLALTGGLEANYSLGTSGQVLSSTGSGVQWITPAGGAAFSELMLIGA